MTDEPSPDLVWVELLQDGMDMHKGDRLGPTPREIANRMVAEGAAEIVEGPAT